MTITTVLTLLVVAYALTPADHTMSVSVVARISAAVVIVVAVTVLALLSVLRAEYPILRAMETIAILVGLMLVGFAEVYLRASTSDPASFSEPLDHVGALYFSLTGATTVGFGDITPRSDAARIAVMIQMVCNVVVIGVTTRLLIGAAQRRSGSGS